jgi:hypothetical protein
MPKHKELIKADSKVPGQHVVFITHPMGETPEDFEFLGSTAVGFEHDVDVAVNVDFVTLLQFPGNTFVALQNHLQDLILGDLEACQGWRLVYRSIAPIGGESKDDSYIGGVVTLRVKAKLEQI